MTPIARFIRRALFLPVNEAVDRERRLVETQVAVASAKRSLDNACYRLARKAAEIHALSDGVLVRNQEAKETGE